MPGRAAKKAADVETRGDRELVYAARDGDMQAFDGLFYRYKDGIFRLGLAITKDPSAAEEIVIDTFARAHRSSPKGRSARGSTGSRSTSRTTAGRGRVSSCRPSRTRPKRSSRATI